VRNRLVGAVVLSVLVVAAAACGSEGGEGGDDAATTTTAVAEPVDYATRGPYAVGEVDLQLDEDHTVAVFYPVDREAAEGAEPYSYAGEDIFGPEIVSLLPGALSGEITPPDTYVDVPASEDGPFPVVMHSHGAAGNLRFANLHNSHVASWGYVVAAVDHPERGVVAALSGATGGEAQGACAPRDDAEQYVDSDQLADGLDLLAEESETAGSPLEGVVDADQVAAEGHSAGGSASGTLAYDDRVDLWIGQAPGTPLEPGTEVSAFTTATERADGSCEVEVDTEGLLAEMTPPSVPSLIIAAEGDSVVELDRVQTTYDWLDAPKRLVEISDSGHAVFVDHCPLIQQEGGLSAFVEALGLDPEAVPLVELGENGCLPDDTPAETVWAFIDHVTVAQLNETFDIDAAAATASLDPDYLAETFPDRFGSEQSEP